MDLARAREDRFIVKRRPHPPAAEPRGRASGSRSIGKRPMATTSAADGQARWAPLSSSPNRSTLIGSKHSSGNCLVLLIEGRLPGRKARLRFHRKDSARCNECRRRGRFSRPTVGAERRLSVQIVLKKSALGRSGQLSRNNDSNDAFELNHCYVVTLQSD